MLSATYRSLQGQKALGEMLGETQLCQMAFLRQWPLRKNLVVPLWRSQGELPWMSRARPHQQLLHARLTCADVQAHQVSASAQWHQIVLALISLTMRFLHSKKKKKNHEKAIKL